MNPDTHEAVARRRRKISRSMREQTPDPKFMPATRRRRSEDEEEEQLAGTTASEEATAQTIRMQLRPPGFMSAHQSKILRRRDKKIAETASRSHSQPRQAERLSSPEANDLLRNVKRSLSSPRNKEESSESEFITAPIAVNRSFSPETSDAKTRQHMETVMTRGRTARSNGNNNNIVAAPPPAATADENLSRLELNLRRFEDERKRFEAEKRLFEREKREHKLRHKQLLDNEERKRLLQSYRKLSDHMTLPTDAEERRRMVHSLRLNRNELPAPMRAARMRNPVYDESSTQFSSSDADADDVTMATRLTKQMSPVRRHASALATRSPIQPPKPPERQRSSSRNNSLSPIRPQRRSKTPETRYQNGINEEIPKAQLSAPERNLTASTTELESEVDALRRRRVRKESLKQTEVKRRQSLEAQLKTVENAAKETAIKEATEEPKTAAATQTAAPIGIIERIFNIFRVKKDPKDVKVSPTQAIEKTQALTTVENVESIATKTSPAISQKIFSWSFIRLFCIDARKQWRCLRADYPHELAEYQRLRRKCIAHTIMLILLCGFGGLMFRYTEGTSEDIYKCEVRKVKRDFIDNLWSVSHNMREDDWKTLARQKLRKFEEELYALQLLGVLRYPGQHSWNFVNCILYCWTVVTTIGYGHITPKTTLGRSLTIIYAIIGIPMFLILLADFGKLFTRGMKFLWAYVRRLYYTGTCRQIRKQQQVRDAMSGFNTVYNFATRRPSYYFGGGGDADIESQSEAAKSIGASHPETPTSPYPETFEIDDEFNLPVSVATSLLIGYILFGTFVYTLWEDWTYFEAFYFVFISMSTIGFGDLVPKHPIFMMCSIVYLVFGLALTSMFINVVQIKLSDTFKQASAKIGATIGLGIASEMGDEGGSQVKTPSDITSVHGSRLDKIAEDENESRRSPGSPQLTSILRPPRPVSPPSSPSPPSATSTQQNGQNEQNGQKEEFSDLEQMAPPLLPRRQVSMEPTETEKKKKKRFFK